MISLYLWEWPSHVGVQLVLDFLYLLQEYRQLFFGELELSCPLLTPVAEFHGEKEMRVSCIVAVNDLFRQIVMSSFNS
jgi:hypothetical protein